jgi:hypothetical protein
VLKPKIIAVAASVAAIGVAPSSALAGGHHHHHWKHHHCRHHRVTTTNTATNTATVTIRNSVLVNSPVTVIQAAAAGSTITAH